MTEWGQPGGEPPRYAEAVDPNAAPPAYGYPPAPYQGYPPQPGYPQQAGYPQQPGYPQQAGYPGYPPSAHNPWAYPQPFPAAYPQQNSRPGTAIASAVLGYVNAGILILAGALLLFGASIVNDIENSANSTTDYGTEIAIDGFLNFIAAGLLIAGAIMLTGHNPVGRLLYTIGAVVVLGEAVYWLVRFNNISADVGGFIVWSVLFIALSVVGLALVWTSAVNRWMAART